MIERNKAAAAATAWWRELTPAEGRKGDRGALARLRRCATVAEAMQLPETMALLRCCQGGEHDLPTLALTAVVLAHVREDHAGKVARQLGPEDPERPDSAILKPLRFRRLLETMEPDESLTALRRLVALANGQVNVWDLSRALLDWLHPARAEETKRRWVFAYWNADPAPAAREGATQPAEATAP